MDTTHANKCQDSALATATCPISFTLVVDGFGVKYTNKNDVNHLNKCLKTDYKLTKDWDGNLYCGIKLKWD